MYDKRPPLIAKSPSCSEGGTGGGGGTGSGTAGGQRNILLLAANLQAISGLLMLIFGVLCAVYGASLSRLGAGLWGGLVALGCGALGTAASLRPRLLHYTLHLALCLVSLAVSTLVLLLTLTAAVRDSIPPEHHKVQSGGLWAGQWSDLGLLGATSLHLLATLVAVPLSCRKACANNSANSQDLLDTKHHLVSSWLGRHNPPPHFIAPHLVVDVPAVYTLPFAHRAGLGLHPPMRPYRPHRSHRPPSSQVTSIEPSLKPHKKKKKELTDEDIDKTYTGLDREIAEEFISIAMQPKAPSTRSASSLSQILP